MGLIKAAVGAAGGVLADQWKEFFYCDSMTADILMMKGQKRTSSHGRSSNTGGEDNIISNGSKIAVNNGQCMMIVESGKVVDISSEPGEYIYDKSSEPSIFTSGLKQGVRDMFSQTKERFTFGGDTGKDQRVYYFNMKEITGNKYGTPAEVPFKMKDPDTGQILTIRIRCFGEYSYHITDPFLFYSNVAGNAGDVYDRSQLDSQLKSELLNALQPAFAKLSAQRIDYVELPGRTFEIADALNDVLSKKWRELRGIEIVSFGINSIKANEEDEAKIQKVQMGKTMSDPSLAMGAMADSTSDAMRMAAQNEGGGGAAFGFMNMNMAGNAGAGMYQQMAQQQQLQQQQQQQLQQQQLQQQMAMQQQQLAQQQAQLEAQKAEFARQQQEAAQAAAVTPQAPAAPAPDTWTCTCGQENTGKFCLNCGQPKPAPKPAEGIWTCECGQENKGKFCVNCGKPKPEEKKEEAQGWTCPQCGAVNQGKFCMECGAKKPEEAPLYKCDKCGWQPPDPHHPPKFCPNCGDPFGDEDKV